MVSIVVLFVVVVLVVLVVLKVVVMVSPVAKSETSTLICFLTINSDRSGSASIQFESCDCSNRRSPSMETTLIDAT